MVSDPFAHHPSENLEASTALTRVSEDAMDHAASEAARQVKAAVSKPQRPGKRGKSLAPAAPPMEPTRQAREDVVDAPLPSSVDMVAMDVPAAEIGPDAGLPSVEDGPPPDVVDLAPPCASETSEDLVPHEESHPFTEEEFGTVAVGEESFGAPEALPPIAEPEPDSHETLKTAATASEEAAAEVVEPQAVEDAAALAQDLAESTAGVVAHAAEVAAVTAEVAPPPNSDVMLELGSKLAETVRGTIDASMTFWMAMLKVKSPAEAIELNGLHLRRQMDHCVSHYQELSALTRKAMVLSMTSLAGSFDRPFRLR